MGGNMAAASTLSRMLDICGNHNDRQAQARVRSSEASRINNVPPIG